MAGTPPMVKVVGFVKLVPVIVTRVPTEPVEGLKEVMFIGDRYVKPGKVAAIPAVVTLTLPLAPLPTTAVMDVALTTLKDKASIPPKLTEVVPVKLVPVIFTVVPVFAVVGVNDVRVSGCT